jgi:ion channel-forming bestrophin family protein
MTIARNLTWFQLAYQGKGSVLPIVLPRILIFTVLGLGVSVLEWQELLPEVPLFGAMIDNVVCNLVLGLLLVFRTNTAYDRFWDGRQAWGDLVVNVRSLLREMQTGLMQLDSTAGEERDRVLKYLAAFVVCVKLVLRSQSLDGLKNLLDESEIAKLKSCKSAPLEILLWVGSYIQQLFDRGILDSNQRYGMNCIVNKLVDGFTTCERIQSTPIPLAYSVYLKRLTVLYCGLVPFNLVGTLHFGTAIVTGLIAFILLSVEEIGNEIEDPFGLDLNDLPLDQICEEVVAGVEGAIVKRPYVVCLEK